MPSSMFVLGHVAGLPIEETIRAVSPAVTAAMSGVLVVRLRLRPKLIALARRRNGRPGSG